MIAARFADGWSNPALCPDPLVLSASFAGLAPGQAAILGGAAGLGGAAALWLFVIGAHAGVCALRRALDRRQLARAAESVEACEQFPDGFGAGGVEASHRFGSFDGATMPGTGPARHRNNLAHSFLDSAESRARAGA